LKAKRGNNEGTIKRRSDGRWEARITTCDGTRKSFYGRTRQEVARRLTEALRDQDRGLPIVGDRQTVKQYLTSWLESAKSTIKLSTWIRYERFVRRDALPALGAITLSKLSPQHLQALYAARLAAGAATTTVIHLHALLHLALDEALRLGLVQRNVTNLVNPPRRVREEMKALTPEQARRFLEVAAETPLEAFYVLAVMTGMRIGELLALKWRDVDLDCHTAQVRATVQRLGPSLAFSEPKSARSRRKVALPQLAVEALRRHRARQAEERLSLGPAWDDIDLVFPNSVGRPMEHSNLRIRSFQPLLMKAELPKIRLHDLRHTAATLLLLQGVHVKVVSEMLGHASIAITLDLYSHVLPDMQREATAAMDRLFSNDGAPVGVKIGVKSTKRKAR
jgi:integrase